MSVTGMGPGPIQPMPAAQSSDGAMRKPSITHIEIRRVQNGFVVAGINMELYESHALGTMPQRATFIAKDIAELSSLLEWIATGSEMKWLPTVDLPVWDMHQREAMRQHNQASPAPDIANHQHQISPDAIPLGQLMVKVP